MPFVFIYNGMTKIIEVAMWFNGRWIEIYSNGTLYYIICVVLKIFNLKSLHPAVVGERLQMMMMVSI